MSYTDKGFAEAAWLHLWGAVTNSKSPHEVIHHRGNLMNKNHHECTLIHFDDINEEKYIFSDRDKS